MNDFAEFFYLDKKVTHLNHGSFGACPIPVMEKLFQYQLAMENNPMEILLRQALSLLEKSRTSLGLYLNCPEDDVVYFPNPTTAMNMVIKNLDIKPGDEILTTNHEYGALDRAWNYYCKRSGAKYVAVDIPLPLPSAEEIVEIFRNKINPKTKYLYISHISSATAVIFPVKPLIELAKEFSLTTIIDGAHTPSQLDLDIADLAPDIYVGSCHKWLCGPKGTAFLYATKPIQKILDPLVISWGYDSDFPSSSRFIDYHEWQGTRDFSPFLAVPDAIEFQKTHDWSSRRENCRNLVEETLQDLYTIPGVKKIYPENEFVYSQMAAVEIPNMFGNGDLQKIMLEKYGIEVMLPNWQDRQFLRFSIQAYNDKKDADLLVSALRKELAGITYD